MIAIYALYRLLWRPAILAFYVIFAGITLLALWIMGAKLDILSEPGRLILVTMALPSIAGIAVGQSVGELQHTPISWSLPRLSRLLSSSVCITGIGLAALTTWAYYWMGGFAPAIPILASCFLWYSLAFPFGTYEFVDARSLRYRKSSVFYFAILIFVFGILSTNRITDLYVAQPALFTLVTPFVAILYLRRSFATKVARGKSLVSMPLFHRFTFGPYQTARMAARRDSRQRWNRAAPLTGLDDWVRAAVYENYGTVRIGWFGWTLLYSVGMLVALAIIYRVFGHSHVHGVVGASLGLGLVMLQQSLYVQKGQLYPLSRPQLARLAFWSALIYNALFCGSWILGYFLLEGLTGIFAGTDLVRPVLLMFICNPVIQWVRFRNEDFKVSSYVILALFLIGYSVLCTTWLEFGCCISFAYEASAVAGLILLSQYLFRCKFRRHFNSGDLV
ncbi:MAG: hypothetical protein OXR72_03910 [Gemmatimonadota bacterium]|nr:hypothetical protein [Gemmatimonadota bacterium]